MPCPPGTPVSFIIRARSEEALPSGPNSSTFARPLAKGGPPPRRSIGPRAGGSIMPERIGFLGIGRMGQPMAANLVRKGFDVTTIVHRRPEPAQALETLGAR